MASARSRGVTAGTLMDVACDTGEMPAPASKGDSWKARHNGSSSRVREHCL